tara:strand:+ start:593 stop:832 length:240 start_codon:yes stop_codon:yes gene_type:complete
MTEATKILKMRLSKDGKTFRVFFEKELPPILREPGIRIKVRYIRVVEEITVAKGLTRMEAAAMVTGGDVEQLREAFMED